MYLVQYLRSYSLTHLCLLVITEIMLLVTLVRGLALIFHPHHIQPVLSLLLT